MLLRSFCTREFIPKKVDRTILSGKGDPASETHGITQTNKRLLVDFEHRSGQKVKPSFGSGGATKQRVLDGEAFDVPIAQPPLDSVRACGHVAVASETPLASVAVAVSMAVIVFSQLADTVRLSKRTRLEIRLCRLRGRRGEVERMVGPGSIHRSL